MNEKQFTEIRDLLKHIAKGMDFLGAHKMLEFRKKVDAGGEAKIDFDGLMQEAARIIDGTLGQPLP